jgi:prepilin-type N-terminal cleavage/methylation domain-containing protein
MLKNSHKKQAFSLLELSVVIVIIGILITGIMKGSSLIASSRINSARSLTARSPVGEINGLAAWYETTSLQSFGKRTAGGSGAPPNPSASISATQLKESDPIELWRDIGPKCINNYAIFNSSGSTQADYNDTCNALSQATTNSRPSYSLSGINNLPSVSFASGQTLLLNALKDGALNASTKIVVFSVDYKPSSGNSATILNNNPIANTQRIFIDPTNISVDNGGTSANISATYSIKNTYIVAVIFNGSNSYYKINNVAITALASTIGTNSSNDLTVGGTNFVGKISEIIIFNRMLKETEITEIFNYLGKKYKVTV